jgi:ribosomal protein S12 methylthiotransferase
MQRAAAPKVSFVSLGCPKALVDSERIITRLRAEGYELARKHDGADLVIVNTCGFLDSAKQESLSAIGEAMATNGKVIVTGCMGAEPSRSSRPIPACSRSPGRSNMRACWMPYTGPCRRCTIRISIWCRRKASS